LFHLIIICATRYYTLQAIILYHTKIIPAVEEADQITSLCTG